MSAHYKVTATLEFDRTVGQGQFDSRDLPRAADQFGLHGRITSVQPTTGGNGRDVQVELTVEYQLPRGALDPETLGLIFEELDSTDARAFRMEVAKEKSGGFLANIQFHQHYGIPPGQAFVHDPAAQFAVIGNLSP